MLIHLLNAAKICISHCWMSRLPPRIGQWLAAGDELGRMENVTAVLARRKEAYHKTWIYWNGFQDTQVYRDLTHTGTKLSRHNGTWGKFEVAAADTPRPHIFSFPLLPSLLPARFPIYFFPLLCLQASPTPDRIDGYIYWHQGSEGGRSGPYCWLTTPSRGEEPATLWCRKMGQVKTNYIYCICHIKI